MLEMIYHGEHGNPNQWGKKNWHPKELIISDIEHGCSYVCEKSMQPTHLTNKRKQKNLCLTEKKYMTN
jgi:hypothetical protein